MTYRLTRRAQAQQKSAIVQRANHAGIAAAENLRDAFEKIYEMLGDFPQAGNQRSDLTHRDVRLFQCDVYWVVHKFRPPDDADIIAIIDMRQELENALSRTF